MQNTVICMYVPKLYRYNKICAHQFQTWAQISAFMQQETLLGQRRDGLEEIRDRVFLTSARDGLNC
jgi:sigma54-dependent transcription regulator